MYSDKEVWRDIPGYEGRYRVSSHGRLYSVPRYIEKRLPNGTEFRVWWRGGVRKLRTDSSGYPCAYFGRLKGPLANGVQIHTVVALAFIGPRPKGSDVRHKDNDRKNNHYENLEYGSRTKNIIDARRKGTPWKKLTFDQAEEIRWVVRAGIPRRDVAEAYGVSVSALNKVVYMHSLRPESEYV